MIANSNLVNNFVECNINGINARMYNGSMRFVNDTLFSYNTAICQYNKKNRTFIVNMTKYSPTTSKHSAYLINTLKKHKVNYSEIDKVKINTTNLIKH